MPSFSRTLAVLACVALVSLSLLWVVDYVRLDVEPPRNVILISLDTLRADHLGVYGYERDTSPGIDAFARRAFVFERALASAPNTPPSQMSMMTSLYPGRHGFTGNGDRLAPGLETLAGRLKQAGLQTAGFVDGGYLRGHFGFDRGFDTYVDAGGGIAAILQRAVGWLSARGQAPFFLFLHCYDIHAPYISPPPFLDMFHDRPYEGDFVPTVANLHQVFMGERRLSDEDMAHVVARYDEGIRYTDAQLGGFLRYLGKQGYLANTTVIITSDHGEEFGEHGSVLHWQLYYQPNLRVPLIVWLPGESRSIEDGPIRVADSVELVDLLPTVLEMVRAPALEEAQGGSFARLLGRYSKPWTRGLHRLLLPISPARPSFAWWSDPRALPLRSITKGDHQLIFSEAGPGNEQLFDLRVDPMAGNNLAAEEVGRVGSLRELGMQVMESNRAAPYVGEGGELDEKVRKQLEALGYGL